MGEQRRRKIRFEHKAVSPPKIITEILKFNVRVTKKASVHRCLPDPATLCLSGFSTIMIIYTFTSPRL